MMRIQPRFRALRPHMQTIQVYVMTDEGQASAYTFDVPTRLIGQLCDQAADEGLDELLAFADFLWECVWSERGTQTGWRLFDADLPDGVIPLARPFRPFYGAASAYDALWAQFWMAVRRDAEAAGDCGPRGSHYAPLRRALPSPT